MRKLSREDVLEIYRRAENLESYTRISEDFKVSVSCVSGIARGKTWCCIQRKPLHSPHPAAENARISVKERLERNIKKGKDGECHEWVGLKSPKGYGKLRVAGKHLRAHRAVYEMYLGKIPDGLMVLHSCDNPSCCNLAHLRVGSCKDNALDRVKRGRGAVLRGEDRWNSRLTENNVRDIKARIRNGDKLKDIAKEYGVSDTTISALNTGHSWSWVA